MAPLQSRASLVNRDDLDDNGASCSSDAWSCLTTTGQFGVVFSIIIVVLASGWIYWYTVIRPRKEKVKSLDQDIELEYGDGRTFIIASRPHERGFALRVVSPSTPPPPAYRPPTPGHEPLAPSDVRSSTPTPPQPSPRHSRTQTWAPQPD